VIQRINSLNPQLAIRITTVHLPKANISTPLPFRPSGGWGMGVTIFTEDTKLAKMAAALLCASSWRAGPSKRSSSGPHR
jgi:hypothetical protein